ncbi:MAG TPA: hypothetical protein VFX35_09240 [Solirubrobacterales bacterium]|nr:hypothetical protein [Solirubrobacterales bacterium]
MAHAEEATGPVYTPDVPTVPQEQSPGGTHNGGSKGANGGGEGAEAEKANAPGGTGSGGGNGSQGGGSQGAQGNQGSTGNGGQPGSGSNDAGGSVGEGKPVVNLGENTADATEDDSSSPLVPILIAIVVLAAISIGAFYYRQRRQGAGSSVSPKAS